MYTYGISFQLCFVPPWFLLQSWTAGIPPGVLHGPSFGQHFVVLFCLLHAARVSGSGSDAISPIFGVLGAPLYFNIHFCQGKPYMNLYGMFTVKTEILSFLVFPPCRLTQWFHNFCALQKLGQKCYYSLCWLQPVISQYFMDPYIFSKNGGSAALSPHHNCRIDRWMDTVSI